MARRWRRKFPPGRLDFVLYSDAVIVKEHAFVLETESTPEDVLEPLGLMQDDTYSASDHLPVVMDFTVVSAPSRTRMETA